VAARADIYLEFEDTMRKWRISIFAWVDEDRKIDKPYQYEIAAEREHTAVHRAMMAFYDEVGRFHSFGKLTAEVSRAPIAPSLGVRNG
jgi:hypothetical protein